MINPSLPIPGVSGCNVPVTPTEQYEIETTCVVENDNLYIIETNQFVTPPTVKIFDFAGVDVTGTVTPAVCPAGRNDVEYVCYQDITDPTIKYSRVDVWDVTVTPAVLTGSVWLDANGAVIAAPSNVEPCGEQTLPIPIPQRVIVNTATWVAPANATSYSFHARQGANGSFKDALGNTTTIVQGEAGSYDSNQSSDIPFGNAPIEITSIVGDIVIEYITI